MAPCCGVDGAGQVVIHVQSAGGDDLDFRIDGLECDDGGRPVHDRHGHVGDDRGDFIPAQGVKLDGLGAVGGRQDAVAEIVRACLARFRGWVPRRPRPAPVRCGRAAGWDCSRPPVFRGGRGGAGGKIDLEDAALARLAVTIDETAVAFDDGQRGGQAQPGALALLLGGEERLEYPVLNFLRHSRPGVRHADDHVVSGFGFQIRARRSASSSTMFSMRRDNLPPPGMASRALTAEIQQNLFELRRVAGDGPEVGGALDFKLQGFGEGLADNLLDFVGRCVWAESGCARP